MFEPIGKPRRLKWPLYNQETNGNITEPLELEPNEFVWPEDSTERVLFPLFISLEEFTALSSAIDVGADIAYPHQYIEVLWIWMRQQRYSMDLCTMIADCITTSETTRNAIKDLLFSDPEIANWNETSEGVVPSTQLATNFGAVADCDPDLLFNVATTAVNLLNSLSEDVFQVVEVGTNALERGELLVSGIPILGALLPFDEIIGLGDKVISSFQEAYEAAYTETLEDSIRCGLFCASKDGCNLTIADMIAYYEVEFAHSLPTDILGAIVDIATFLAEGTFSGDTIVYGMHLLVLATIRSAEGLVGIDFAQMGLRLVAAQDDPDNDWETLCDDCPPEDDCVDFTTGLHGFTVLNNNPTAYGTQINGVGLRSGTQQVAFNGMINFAGATKFIVEFNGPVTGSLNVRNSNGTAGAVHTLTLANTASGFYTINKSPGVMTQSIYIGYIPTSPGGLASTYRVRGICYE